MFAHSHKTLFVILGAALVLRLVIFFTLQTHNDDSVFWMGDTKGYMQIADNLNAGHGYSEAAAPPFTSDGSRVPVLPILLAITKSVFGSPVPLVIVQLILGSVIAYLAYAIALEVTGHERFALVAAALAAFEPYGVGINFSLLTETIFATLLLGAVLAMVRYLRSGALLPLLLASALCALCALTRPIAQFLPAILILMVLYRTPVRGYATYILAAVLPFLLVASPWLIRNYSTFGAVSFSSNGFHNVYTDLGASILSYRDGTPYHVEKEKLYNDFAARHGVSVEAVQQDLTLSGDLLAEGMALVVSNPIPAVKVVSAVGLAFFTNDLWAYYPQRWGYMDRYEFGFSPTKSLLTDGPFITAQRVIVATHGSFMIPLLGRLFWVSVTLGFFIGAILLYRGGGAQRASAIFLVLIVLYFFGLCISNGTGINGRYRYPVSAIMYIPALVAFARIPGAAVLVWRRLRHTV